MKNLLNFISVQGSDKLGNKEDMSEDLRTEDYVWKPTGLFGPYKTEYRYWKRRWNQKMVSSRNDDDISK